jgi:sugar lactone lactonase YvrE/enterochelin esterase-like enzyme
MPRFHLGACAPLSLVIALSACAMLHADDPSSGGVPKGEVKQYTFDHSQIFPGTTRSYWVYVPQQYDPGKPACLYVNQDGIQWNAPAVFDELIAKKEMPVTIGVFVTPGRVKAAADTALDRNNRSFEYDGLGDGYARFLLDELLPDVEKKTAGDGRAIHLSRDGNDRGIGGSSSGAICAWTAAWERPDSFRRVFSAIGTYVGLRGGNVYSTLVRKYEPKPLRVFLQDGSGDLNIYGGDWWMANQELERSLIFAGYEVNHVWGEGGHSNEQGTKAFPDAMRWLWKDWPAPIKTGAGSQQLQEVLLPGENWQLVAEGYGFTEGPAENARGEVFFNDVGASKTYKIGLDGKVTLFVENTMNGDGQRFGPDGRLYSVAAGTSQIMAYDPAGQRTAIADGFKGNDLVVRHDGSMYVTNPSGNGTDPSQVWYISSKGEKKVVDSGLKFCNGVTLSPDQAMLYVADSRSHWVYSYQIQPDGSLTNKQKFYHLHVPDTADDSGADGLRVDRDGRLYVATRMGIQICDQAGRANCIVPTPNGKLANFAFGGENFDTLFATCGDRVYRRKLKVKGAQSFLPPFKPADKS